MPARSGTKRSTLRLSEVARHVVIPKGIVSTGWPAVREQCREFGVRFDTWQDGAGRLILGKRSDGLYAATVGGVTLSIPRQVAKTFLVSRIVFALCVLFPGLRAVWTAHRTRTATNTFRGLVAFSRRRSVAPYVESVRSANGEQEIAFVNGSAIMFGAREQGFGRGFDEIDVEVFDEAQILTEKALDDLVAATNQSRHPHGALLFYMGTPPRPIDPGEVFTLRREKALSGKASDAVYIECSADEDADPDDRRQWEKANPSYPDHTPLASMLRLRENLGSDESWLREALGIWGAPARPGVIPRDSWDLVADELSLPTDRLALGVEAAPDLVSASVCLAGQRADGLWHIELREQRAGTAWVAPYLRALLELNPDVRSVALDAGSPTAALVQEIEREGVRVTSPKVRDLGVACSQLLEGVVVGSVRHIGQHQLTSAVTSAGKRALGDTGMWVFSRKSAATDVTPVQAAVLALWASRAEKAKRPLRNPTRTGRRVVTL